VLAKVAARQTLEVDAPTGRRAPSSPRIVSTLDNQIDPATGTLKLRATFGNAKGTLFRTSS
jgi:hypothetical protein